MLSFIMEAVLERTWKVLPKDTKKKIIRKGKKKILKSMIVVALERGEGLG